MYAECQWKCQKVLTGSEKSISIYDSYHPLKVSKKDDSNVE